MFGRKNKEKRRMTPFLALLVGLIIGNKAVPKFVHILYLIIIVVLTVLWVKGVPVPFLQL